MYKYFSSKISSTLFDILRKVRSILKVVFKNSPIPGMRSSKIFTLHSSQGSFQDLLLAAYILIRPFFVYGNMLAYVRVHSPFLCLSSGNLYFFGNSSTVYYAWLPLAEKERGFSFLSEISRIVSLAFLSHSVSTSLRFSLILSARHS